jgi:pyochelin biosynthetic protein PchC
MVDTMTSRWLMSFGAPRPPAVRLVCFPHAGGSASFYQPWQRLLPSDVELVAVQYPGRMNRLAEPCLTDLDEMAERILDALLAGAQGDVAFFGHSMGALIAFEVARRLTATDAPLRLTHLLVSGKGGPPHRGTRLLHLADDRTLCAQLRALGGSSEEALAHPELRAVVLPMLRDDYRLVETWRYRPGPPLSCPVTVLAGADDPETPLGQLDDWQHTAAGPVEVRVFANGGHFYLVPHRDLVVREVVRRLGIEETGGEP